MQPLDYYTWFSILFFFVGLLGMLVRRNLIVLLMCVEMMLNAVNILLVATATYGGHVPGLVFTLFVMVIAAAEVTIGLALLVCIYRHYRTASTENLNRLKA